MQDIIRVDVGHLLSEKEEPGFIPAAVFEDLPGKYGGALAAFQADMRDRKSPVTLSLQENEKIPVIKTMAVRLKEKFRNIVLVGIGGSALGSQALIKFLRGPFYNLEEGTRPRIFTADNADPVMIARLTDLLDFRETGIIYVSKSGSTAESAANFIHFYKQYRAAGGDPKDMVFICDQAENGINRIARETGCQLLHIPKGLSGRFSVLSAVGFLPAELAGIDSLELYEGALAVHETIISREARENPLFALGASLCELASLGKTVHVLFNYSSLLADFGLWFMQIWGESLGKRFDLDGREVRTGTTPLSCVGATDQHSLLQLFKEGPRDKVVGFIGIDKVDRDVVLDQPFPSEIEYAYFAGHSLKEQLDIEQLATQMSLVRTGIPVYELRLKDMSARTMGALFYFYEALTAFTAAVWNINAFDQPGVEEGKHITYALMGRKDYQDRRADFEAAVARYRCYTGTFFV